MTEALATDQFPAISPAHTWILFHTFCTKSVFIAQYPLALAVAVPITSNYIKVNARATDANGTVLGQVT